MFEEIRHRTRAEHRKGDISYRRFVRKMLAKKRFVAFLAETRNGEIAAEACVWIRENQPQPSKKSSKWGAYLMSVYTAPKFRGQGVATRLVKEAMKWVKKKGFNRMTLHASRMGQRMYRKLGWERTWEMRINL
jgi:GNAT superfamily N-acetyltransferase